jgi:hypothetical protein
MEVVTTKRSMKVKFSKEFEKAISEAYGKKMQDKLRDKDI